MLPSGIPVAGLQLQLRVPNWLGSASAGVAVTTVAASAIAAPTINFSMIKDAPLGVDTPVCGILQAPACRGQNAAMLTPTKNPAWYPSRPLCCIMSFATSLDGPTAIESVADLMAGDDRGLCGREGNPLGLQRIQEVGVDGVGMRAWRGDFHDAERGEHQD